MRNKKKIHIFWSSVEPVTVPKGFWKLNKYDIYVGLFSLLTTICVWISSFFFSSFSSIPQYWDAPNSIVPIILKESQPYDDPFEVVYKAKKSDMITPLHGHSFFIRMLNIFQFLFYHQLLQFYSEEF